MTRKYIWFKHYSLDSNVWFVKYANNSNRILFDKILNVDQNQKLEQQKHIWDNFQKEEKMMKIIQ